MQPEDALRQTLEAAGFKVANNGLASRENLCRWYAWRPSAIQARPCECNNKPRMQIEVYPHVFSVDAKTYRSAEVKLVGEAGGVWFDLKAYSISMENLPSKLDAIEAQLVAAWNALAPA